MMHMTEVLSVIVGIDQKSGGYCRKTLEIMGLCCDKAAFFSSSAQKMHEDDYNS